MQGLIYDCEIKRAIPNRDGVILRGIEYCQGWDDFKGMGISVIGAYDYEEEAYRVFCEDNMDEFHMIVDHHTISGGFIAGYNNRKFDDRLVAAHGMPINPAASYDLLAEIWKAAGLGPEFVRETHMGFSLDDMIRANFPEYGKTGDGRMAPVLWQQGKVGKVIDYCLSDVWLTKMLLDRVINGNPLINPKDGELLYVKSPDTYLEDDDV
jgi:hypothetical protein